MTRGAASPEELETLFEDAFVSRDRSAVAALFEEISVLVAADHSEGRGSAGAAQLAASMWGSDLSYVAHPRRIFQARDTGLVLADDAINVVRRGCDGTWRYLISCMSKDQPIEKGDQ